MLDNLKENIRLYILLSVWLVIGAFGGPIIYVVLPLTLILLKRQNAFQELLTGFFFILILSDNLSPAFQFATNVKNIYIVLLAMFLIFDRNEFFPLNTIYKIFIPFFLFSFYCLIFSPAFLVGFQKSLSYALVFLVVPNYFKKCYHEHGTEFLRNILYLGIFLLIIGLGIAVIKPGVAFIDGGRLRGVFGNPNGLGLFCFVLFSFAVAINRLFPSIFSRNEKILIFSVIILSVILSNSRNALMGILILIVFIRFFKRSTALGMLLSMILLFLTVLVSEQIPLLIRSLSLEKYLRLNTLEELSGRAVAWNFAWTKINSSFFVGKGFGYDEFMMRQNYALLSQLGHQGGVHNSFLSMWLNFGLIGLLIYISCFFWTFFRASRKTTLAFPIMFAILFSSTFEGLLIGSLNPHMFLLLTQLTLIFEKDIFQEDNSIKPIAIAA